MVPLGLLNGSKAYLNIYYICLISLIKGTKITDLDYLDVSYA